MTSKDIRELLADRLTDAAKRTNQAEVAGLLKILHVTFTAEISAQLAELNEKLDGLTDANDDPRNFLRVISYSWEEARRRIG